MRPIPAERIGHAHGLLIALGRRGSLPPEDLVAGQPEAELFPPGLHDAAASTRPLLSFARAAGLISEDRGAFELTPLGRRYVESGDPQDVFRVSSGQAEWLRRQLREKHLTESIWNGAAIALSLCASLPDGDWVSALDLGRATAHLGRAGWDSEDTFRSQGQRLTQLLEDIELITAERTLTARGRETIEELQLPPHAGLKDLAGDLHPGGHEGAARAAAAEREALALGPAPAAAAAAAAADPPADASIEVPADDAEADDAIAGPDELTRTYPALTAAAAGRAGSSVAEDAAPALPGEPADPGSPGAPEAEAPMHGLERATRAAAEGAADAGSGGGRFLDPGAVRAAAERRGLVIDPAVHAAAIAALASGRHLVLTGGAGSGKTALALAIAEAAVAQGRCASVLFTSAGAGLRAADILGGRSRDGGEFRPGLVPRAIDGDQWLVIDELDRVKLDRALGAVSSVLAGHPVDLPGAGELSPPADWRMIATMADTRQVGRTTRALRRRFVFVEVPVLERAALETLVETWAGDDAVAAAVGRRLAAVSEVVPLGPGLYRDAIAYVRARRSLADAPEDDLLVEALGGFVLPQLEGEGDDLAALALRAVGLRG